MSKGAPLSPTQQDLLEALQRGVDVLNVTGRQGAYWFRGDTHARCSAQARALVSKDLAVVAGPWNRQHLVLRAAP